MIVERTKTILKDKQLYAKKMLGQNFLIDKKVLETIIDNSGVTKDYNVIEIGPGIGSLTEFLALNAGKVLAYEIDNDMIEILKDTLSPYDNVKIKNIDILEADIMKDIEEYFGKTHKVMVIANLPYYITTPIIFKLLETTNIETFIFMVQKEVGKRLTGKPKTKDYNALSVYMQYKTNSKIFANVGKNSFFPEPNVDSVLLKVEVVKNDYNVKNEGKFVKFIRACFAQRRKTLVNNLSDAYNLSKDEIIKTLEKFNYNTSIRAEELSLDDIVFIYKTLCE